MILVYLGKGLMVILGSNVELFGCELCYGERLEDSWRKRVLQVVINLGIAILHHH
tara:strand:+ start:198 stop:362 length:165 start_codon:yes stop_codon:yes gene_type:complete